MIASLQGQVLKIGLRSVVISVGGVGFEVFCPTSTLSQLREGHEAHLYTHLVVREDAITLYGFLDVDAKLCFLHLLSVSGFGPKTALEALTLYTPAQIANYVAAKDAKALSAINGVGTKSAQRIIIDLGDKIASLRVDSLNSDIEVNEKYQNNSASVLEETTANVPSLINNHQVQADVITAVVNLGWKEQQVKPVLDEALSQLEQESGRLIDSAELLRKVIMLMGGNRG